MKPKVIRTPNETIVVWQMGKKSEISLLEKEPRMSWVQNRFVPLSMLASVSVWFFGIGLIEVAKAWK